MKLHKGVMYCIGKFCDFKESSFNYCQHHLLSCILHSVVFDVVVFSAVILYIICSSIFYRNCIWEPCASLCKASMSGSDHRCLNRSFYCPVHLICEQQCDFFSVTLIAPHCAYFFDFSSLVRLPGPQPRDPFTKTKNGLFTRSIKMHQTHLQ